MDEKTDCDETMVNLFADILAGIKHFTKSLLPDGMTIDHVVEILAMDDYATPKNLAELGSVAAKSLPLDVNGFSVRTQRLLPPEIPNTSKARSALVSWIAALTSLRSCIDSLALHREGKKTNALKAMADAQTWFGFMLGMLQGFNSNKQLEEHHNERVKRGANGRRLIGATSREKVRKAAQNYQHMARDSAAFPIADMVGLAPGTVRRYLSEIFPGEEWNASNDA